jgi:hypothetical protein
VHGADAHNDAGFLFSPARRTRQIHFLVSDPDHYLSEHPRFTHARTPCPQEQNPRSMCSSSVPARPVSCAPMDSRALA